LQESVGRDINGIDSSRCGTLGEHESDQTRPRSYVEDMRRRFGSRPSPQQHAVRPHLHGTTVMPHGKLPEPKERICHPRPTLMNNPHETRRKDTLFRIYPDLSPFIRFFVHTFAQSSAQKMPDRMDEM
jgi:hypothetical protein